MSVGFIIPRPGILLFLLFCTVLYKYILSVKNLILVVLKNKVGNFSFDPEGEKLRLPDCAVGCGVILKNYQNIT